MRKMNWFVIAALLSVYSPLHAVSAELKSERWQTVGQESFSKGEIRDPNLQFDSNNNPLIGLRERNDGFNYFDAFEFNGTHWISSTASDIGGSGYGIKQFIDVNNNRYIAYGDGSNPTKLRVRVGSSTSWPHLQNASSNDIANIDRSSAAPIVADSQGNLFVAYKDDSGGSASGKAVVVAYDGSGNWNALGVEGFSAGEANAISMAIDGNDTLYVAYQDVANSNDITVMTYNGSAWQAVGSAGINAGEATDVKIVIEKRNNIPYIIFTDTNGTDASVVKVKSYNAVGGSWVDVGTPISSTKGSLAFFYTSVRVEPVVATRSGKVQRFNGSEWLLVGNTTVAAQSGEDFALAVNSDNVPYILYQDPNSSKASIIRLEKSALSTGFISPGNEDESLWLAPQVSVEGQTSTTVLTLTVTLSDVAAGLITANIFGNATFNFVNGVATITGTAEEINAVLETLYLTPAADYFGTDYSVSFQVSDGNNTSAAVSSTMTIIAVNDPPTIIGGSDIAIEEDTPSSIALTGVVVSDKESNDVTVNVIASIGTLTALNDGNTIGAGVSVGTGTSGGRSQITISGSLADVNTYLSTADTLQYTPFANIYGSNAAQLNISVRDEDSGGQVSLAINISGVNDAPVIGAELWTVVNKFSPEAIAIDVNVGGSNVSLPLRDLKDEIIKVGPNGRFYALGRFISFHDNTRIERIVLFEYVNNSWQQIGNAMESQYRNSYSEHRLTRLALALDKNNTPYVYYEDSGGVFVETNDESYFLAKKERANFVYFDGNAWVSLRAETLSDANVQIAAYSPTNIYFAYTDDNFDEDEDDLSGAWKFEQYDGSNWVTLPARDYNQKRDAAFEVDNVGNLLVGYTDVANNDGMSVAKYDDTSDQWQYLGTTNITGRIVDGVDLALTGLFVDSDNSIYFSYRDYYSRYNTDHYLMKFDGNSIWQAVGNTKAMEKESQSAEASVGFDENGQPYMAIYGYSVYAYLDGRWQLQGNAAAYSSVGARSNPTVSFINSTPTVLVNQVADFFVTQVSTQQMPNGTHNFTEDTAGALFANKLLIIDYENDQVTLTIELSDAAAGTLSCNDPGNAIYSNTGQTWTLSGSAADVDKAIDCFVYTPAPDYSGSDYKVALTLTDGMETNGPVTITLYVAPVNDKPEFSITSSAIALNEGQSVKLTSSHVSATDIESAAEKLTYKLTASPQNGEIQLDTDGDGSGTKVTFFTQAQVNAGHILYVHDGSETTADTVTFNFYDEGGVNGTGAFLNQTLNFAITPVNDAPKLFISDTLKFVETFQDGDDAQTNEMNDPRVAVLSDDGLHVYVTSADNDAITHFTRDSATGKLTAVAFYKNGQNGITGLNTAVSVIISADGKTLFATAGVSDGFVVFARDTGSGALTFVKAYKDGGKDDFNNTIDGLNNAQRIVFSPDDSYFYISAWSEDEISSYRFDHNTRQVTYLGIYKDGSSGIDGLNEVFALHITKDGKFLYAGGMADNEVAIFARDNSSGALDYQSKISLSQPAGFTFSQDETQVYIPSRSGDKLYIFDRNTTDGTLVERSTIADGTTFTYRDPVSAQVSELTAKLNGPFDVHLDANGRYLYVTAAVEDSLNVFERNPKTGDLSLVAVVSNSDSGGPFGLEFARYVITSPDDRSVYTVAGEDSNGNGSHGISVFHRSPIDAVDFNQFYAEDGDSVWFGGGLSITDAEGNAQYTVTLTLSNINAGTLAAIAAGSATVTFENGVLTISGSLADVNDTLETITFAPSADYDANVDTISIVVSDGLDNSQSTSVVLAPTSHNNDPFQLAVNETLTVDEGATTAVSSTVLQATDPDFSDVLTFTVTSSPKVGQLFIDADSNGKLDSGEAIATDGSGTFTQQNIDDGVLYYAHDDSESTADAFTFDLDDVNDTEGAGTTDPLVGQTLTIAVNPVNESPLFTSTAITTTDEDAVYSYPISAADPEGEVSLRVKPGTPLPDWLQFTQLEKYTTTDFVGSGDKGLVNGFGINAQFDSISSLAIGKNGNFFVADGFNNVIRKVTPGGEVTTFAGSGSKNASEGVGTEAGVSKVNGITFDAQGNMYAATKAGGILKITPQAKVSIIGANPFRTTGGYEPNRIAVDSQGNIYLLSVGPDHSVVKMSSQDGTSVIFAGAVESGEQDGTGTEARFSSPRSIVIDSKDNIFVGDSNNNLIRKITPDGVVSTFAGISQEDTSIDGSGTNATFTSFELSFLTIDENDNLYLSNQRSIRKVTPEAVVTTLFEDSNFDGIYGQLVIDQVGNIYSGNSNVLVKVIAPPAYNLTGTPDNDDVGTSSEVCIEATDETNLTAQQCFNITVVNVNDAPWLATHNALSIVTGKSADISRSVLLASDVDTDDTPDQLTFTVTTLPTDGELKLSGNTLAVNETFTQADINNSLVAYQHAGGITTEDSFVFSLADGLEDGVSAITEQTFNFTIGLPAGPNIRSVSIDNKTYVVGDIVTATIEVVSDADTFSLSSGTIAGFTLNGLKKTSDTTYTATFTITDGGTDIAADENVPMSLVMTDSNNESNTPFTTPISQSGDAIYANLPHIILSTDSPTIVEDAGFGYVTATITNSLDDSWPVDITVSLSMSGTATLDTDTASLPILDYVISKQALTIDAGKSSEKELVIVAQPEGIYEGVSDETVIVDITGVSSGLENGEQQVTFTIEDAQDAPKVRLSADLTRIAENAGTSTIKATLDARTYEDVTVTLAYSGSAVSGSSGDYNDSVSGSITIAAGEVSGTAEVIITAVDNSETDGNKTILVDIADVAGGEATELGTQQLNISIIDDDLPLPTIAGLPSTYTIADGTETAIDLSSVVLNNPNGDEITLTLALSSGTIASVGGDGSPCGFSIKNSGTSSITLSGFVAEVHSHLANTVGVLVTPGENNGSSITLTATVSGNGVEGTPVMAEINVTNEAPVITSDAVTTAIEDLPYSYLLRATDPESDKVSWRVKADDELPEWLELAISDEYTVSTFAGTGSDSSENGPISRASFSEPIGVVADKSGNFYIAEASGHLIRRISAAGEVTTFAGSGVSGSANGSGNAAQFHTPAGLSIDNNGNLYVADSDNHLIRKITPSGEVSTFSGTGEKGDKDGAGTEATFNNPFDTAISASGEIYVAELDGHKIRKIALDGTVSTFYVADEQAPGGVTLYAPSGLVFDSLGNLFVTSVEAGVVYKLTPEAEFSVFAGSFATQEPSADGMGVEARLFGPNGIAIDSDDNLYVTEMLGQVVRKITPQAVVTTIAGKGEFGNSDGIGSNALFSAPAGIEITPQGTLFVTGSGSNLIRKLVSGYQLSGTPENDDVGITDDFCIEAVDTANNTDQQCFSIEVQGVNDAPELAHNKGATVNAGGILTLSDEMLEASDIDDEAAGINYTLTAQPANGELRLSDSKVNVSSVFSQADINNSLVTYVHSGSSTTTDSFTFTLADGGEDNAQAIIDQTFNIQILADNEAPVITGVTIADKPHVVGDEVTATITVSGDSDSFTLKSGSIAGYDLGNLVKGSDTTYTASFIIANGGTDIEADDEVPVNVVLQDSAGNSSNTFTTEIEQNSDAIYANTPQFSLSTNTASLAESGGVAQLSVLMSNSMENTWPQDIQIILDIAGSAEQNTDYSVSSNIVNIGAGSSTGTVTFTGVADVHHDGAIDETIDISINSVSVGTVNGEQLESISIVDVHSAPKVSLSVDNQSIPEDGSTGALVSATLSHATFEDVIIDFLVSGTAFYTDYSIPSPSTITIAKGQTTANFADAVKAIEDSESDPNEVIRLSINKLAGGGAVENGSQQIEITIVDNDMDADVTVTSANSIIEPVAISSLATSIDNAVPIFDFTISDGGSADGVATAINSITLHTSGTADTGNFSYLLNGSDVTNVTGSYSFTSKTVTFSGLPISVANGQSEIYTLSVFHNNNSALVDGQTLILSTDGDTDFTVNNGSTFGSTQPVVNGTGSAIDVTATQLVFTTTSSASVSGVSMSPQPVVQAQDAAGNLDTDFAEIITLSENAAGSLTNSSAQATSGVATFSNTVYTATVDNETFVLTADDEISGSDLPPVNSATVNSDVIATALRFTTEPAPLAVVSGEALTLTTVPVIEAIDGDGTIDIGHSLGITLAVVNSSGSIVMSSSNDVDNDGSTLTGTPSAGAATYNGMSLTYTVANSGNDVFNLQATSGSLSAANSSPFLVNVAPSLSNVPGSFGVIEDAVSGLDLSNVVITDIDNDALVLSLTVAKGTLSSSDGNLTVGNVTIEGSGSASMTLKGTANDLNAYLDDAAKLAYLSTTNDDTDTTLVLGINDGTVSGQNVTATVAIEAVNDRPTISGTPETSVNEFSVYSFTPSAIDIENDVLNFSAVNLPTWLSINAKTGELSGTPSSTDVGTSASIVVTVSDGNLTADLTAFTITVVNVNDAPVITGSPLNSIQVVQSYSFTPNVTDKENDTLIFSIENKPSWASFSSNTGALTGTPQTTDVGSYSNILIAVSDGKEQTSMSGFNIAVTAIPNTPPVISGTPQTSVVAGQSYDFTPTVVDKDNDVLTFSIANKPGWVTFDSTNGRLFGTPQTADIGAYANITISVSDGEANVALAAFSMAVTELSNTAPVISGTPLTSVDEDTLYSFTPTASDADSGDSLTFSIINPPSWSSFDVATGILKGTPGNDDVGTTSGIVISAVDSKGASASLGSFNLTVNAVNDAPSVKHNTGFALDEGQTVKVVTDWLSVTDIDNTAAQLLFTVTESLSQGALFVDGNNNQSMDGDEQVLSGSTFSQQSIEDGQVFYVHDGSETTTDHFVFTLSDGVAELAAQRSNITINPVNDAPVISGTPSTSIQAGVSYSFTPVGSDAENDSLTFSIVKKPVWANFDSTTGTLSGTPNIAHLGSYPGIEIAVSDGNKQTALNAFSLAVTELPNTPPTITGTPLTQVEEGQTYSFAPVAGDEDSGDVLSFTIVNQPAWAKFDSTTGILNGIPATENIGTTNSIVISVRDKLGASASLTAFNLSVTKIPNNAPLISGEPLTSIQAGQLYRFAPVATDADNDAMTFSIVNQPSWSSFDSKTGQLSGTPQNTDIKAYSGIVISVTDGKETASLSPFSLAVTELPNTAPTIAGKPLTRVDEDNAYLFTPTANDTDSGDSLTFAIVNKPTWASFDTVTGSLSGTPGNNDVNTTKAIVISVLDSAGASASLTSFDLTVNAVNDAPVMTNNTGASVMEGQTVRLTNSQLLVSDVDNESAKLVFTLTSIPSNGVMFVDGNGDQADSTSEVLSLGSTFSQFDIDSGKLFYRHSGSETLSDTIVFNLTDGIAIDALSAQSFNITVSPVNDAPVISGTPTTSIQVFESYVFAPVASDVENDTLSFSISNKPDWAEFDVKSAVLSGMPVASNIGNYPAIAISVKDGEKTTTLPAFSLAVTELPNASPVITGIPQQVVNEGSIYDFTPVASDADIGDSLVFAITNQPTWVTFDNTTGRISGTPGNADINTTKGIVISVQDNAGASASLVAFDLTVKAVNDAPILLNNIGLRVEEGQILTILTDWLSASDIDNGGNELLFTLTQTADHGALFIDNNGNGLLDAGETVSVAQSFSQQQLAQNKVLFSHDGSESTADGFEFSLSDGQLALTAQRVAIEVTPVNDAPLINGVPITSIQALQAYTFTPSASDVENNSLTFSIAQKPQWASFDETTGILNGTPAIADIGSYPGIIISVSDGDKTTELPAFSMAVTQLPNAAPVISGSPNTLVDEGELYDFMPVASDADKDNLTFSVNKLPIWATFDTSTGRMTGTPGNNDVGTIAGIVISVVDSVGASASLAVINLTVTAVNDPPSLISNSGFGVNEGQISMLSNSELFATDIDNAADALTYTVKALPSHGSLFIDINQNQQFDLNETVVFGGTFSQLAINSAQVFYRHDGSETLADRFVFSLSDGMASLADMPMDITVNPVNDAPNINGVPSTTVEAAQTYAFTPRASDVDSESLTFTIVNQPDWASFDTASGNLSGTPAESAIGRYDNIVIGVTDGQASSQLSAFAISVTEIPNVAPVITGQPATSVEAAQSYVFTPNATDADNNTLFFSITNKPDWAGFNTATGSLTGVPSEAAVGIYTNIIVSVSDGKETVSLAPFSIQVTEIPNQPPTGQAMTLAVNEDTSQSILPALTDENLANLTLIVVSNPQRGTLTENGLGWRYQPNVNVHGSDAFSYQVFDGELTSETYTVSITINPVNDQPTAVNDNFSVVSNAQGLYSLDVLSNDSDIDGDALVLSLVESSIGAASISNNQIQYQVLANFNGSVSLSYSITDGKGKSATANVSLTITGDNSNQMPTLTVPADIEINAEGLITKVELGVAQALNAEGNPIAVTLADSNSNLLRPGLHEVYWIATDSNGNSVTQSQQVKVHPLVSFSKDQTVAEGNEVTVTVHLNGVSADYPMNIGYTVSGTANSADHDLVEGTLTITSGTEKQLTFNVFEDGLSDPNETIILTLDSNLNVGAQSSLTINISEANISPEVALSVEQAGVSRLTVDQAQGLVTVSAKVSDANVQDVVALSWQAGELVNQSTTNDLFVFDPASVNTGIYPLTAVVSDNGEPALSNNQQVYIEVKATLQVLSETLDSDGDLIPDAIEGYGDSDGDGIPDYLDAINECNVVPGQLADDRFLAEGDPGVCLRKGQVSATSSSGGLQVGQDISLSQDVEADNIGGVFDFIAYGLPEAGRSYRLVLPQRQPIPANAVYRKLIGSQWQPFVVDQDNNLFSSEGESGVCPPPGSALWQEGLIEGFHCVQLLVQDGGPNDDDGEANGAIVDPSGVAVIKTNNSFPVAQPDSIETPWRKPIIIDVVANDTDADDDVLMLSNAAASIGLVTLINEQQLQYTPADNFAGVIEVSYSITDGKGGTANGILTVTVLANRAPLAVNDIAQTKHTDSVLIDVLANDSDLDGNSINLLSAVASTGDVLVGNQQLIYTPILGSESAQVTIDYVIADEYGAKAQATVTVSVIGNQLPITKADSASTDSKTAITIDVLGNDSDADGNNLDVTAATVDYGFVMINGDNTLTYTPEAGFDGIASISYEVSDGFDTSIGLATISVDGYQQVKINNRSGGSLLWLLCLIGLLAIGRRINALKRG